METKSMRQQKKQKQGGRTKKRIRNQKKTKQGAISSLNGAKIQSVVDVVEAVHNGIIEKEAAIELLTKSLSFDRESARKIIGNHKIQEVAPVQQKGENIEN